MSVCLQVYVRQGTSVLCMYVYRCPVSVCGSYALGFAPGGSCEDVNKENEEVLSVDMSQLQIQDSQETASNLETTVREYCASLLYYFGYWGSQPIFPISSKLWLR